MSAGNNKLKLLYLMQIFMTKTDENHGISLSEIGDYLASYGVKAERKTLYSDMDLLRQFGMDITVYKENRTYYYQLSGRDFELAELKLLVDSVQSARFITEKKSRQLIKKIEKLASDYESSKLSRQVYVSGRVKSINEGILYNVDTIHTAISEKKNIRFQYFNWNPDKEQVLRHDGQIYQVSPFALSWDDDNYYLIAYDSAASTIKHFRVDKMLSIEIVDKRREGLSLFKSMDMAAYTRKMFGMWDGDEVTVTLRCDDSMAGVIIDRFGIDVPISNKKGGHFDARVKVAISRKFLSWVISLGDKVKITAPKPVVDLMRQEAKRLMEQYK